jgi:hypothetical protein
MQSVVDAPDGLFDGYGIANISLHQVDLREENFQVLPFAGGEVIQNPNPVFSAQQSLNDMRADETSSTGDQKKGHGTRSFLAKTAGRR